MVMNLDVILKFCSKFFTFLHFASLHVAEGWGYGECGGFDSLAVFFNPVVKNEWLGPQQ